MSEALFNDPPILDDPIVDENEESDYGWYYDALAGGYRIPFGKYRGRFLHEASISYLYWYTYLVDPCDRCFKPAFDKFEKGLHKHAKEHYGDFIVPFGRKHRGKKIKECRDKDWFIWTIETCGLKNKFPIFFVAVQHWLNNPHHQGVKRDIGELLSVTEYADDLDLENGSKWDVEDEITQEDWNFINNSNTKYTDDRTALAAAIEEAAAGEARFEARFPGSFFSNAVASEAESSDSGTSPGSSPPSPEQLRATAQHRNRGDSINSSDRTPPLTVSSGSSKRSRTASDGYASYPLLTETEFNSRSLDDTDDENSVVSSEAVIDNCLGNFIVPNEDEDDEGDFVDSSDPSEHTTPRRVSRSMTKRKLDAENAAFKTPRSTRKKRRLNKRDVEPDQEDEDCPRTVFEMGRVSTAIPGHRYVISDDEGDM